MQGGVVTFIGLVEPSTTGIKMRYQGIKVLICTKSSDQGMFCSDDQAVILKNKQLAIRRFFDKTLAIMEYNQVIKVNFL